jgi:hypothetical protein
MILLGFDRIFNARPIVDAPPLSQSNLTSGTATVDQGLI